LSGAFEATPDRLALVVSLKTGLEEDLAWVVLPKVERDASLVHPEARGLPGEVLYGDHKGTKAKDDSRQRVPLV
jgi:hypothetical protein